MYGCDSWTIKKGECQKTDTSELWCWRRLLKVHWTETRSNEPILKEINPEYSLEGLMLKLKHQYSGHLMWSESLSVGSDSLQPHGLQHARLPCLSLSPRVAQTHVHWVDGAIWPSHPLLPPSLLPSIFLASGFFPVSWLFTSDGCSTGVSASANFQWTFRVDFL